MATVTITITDGPAQQVCMKLESDPELPAPAELKHVVLSLTLAQQLGIMGLTHLKGLIEHFGTVLPTLDTDV